MIKIYLPKNLNFILINNSYTYIYNEYYFIGINTFYLNFYYNNFLKTINIKKKNILHIKYNKNFFNIFLFSWDNFFFSKIYFIGKGFKLKKLKNNIHLNFNYSHINILINQKTIIKKIQKNKLLIFGKNFLKFKKSINYILNIKNLNKYTKRGLRQTKQIVYKKKSKGNV